MPWYLLMPLASSMVFVLAMMLVKRAIERGTSPWTGTFLANVWLAIGWGALALVRGKIVGPAVWDEAALIALLFVLGQLFTYLAFQFGDVSVATPIFGVKILMVAVLNAILTDNPLSRNIWIGALLATTGVALVQVRPRAAIRRDASVTVAAVSHETRRLILTVVMALSAAFSLSCFDLLLQNWGTQYNTAEFLPAVFILTAVFSVVFLPWVDRPAALQTKGALRWILGGTVLMAIQALGMCVALSTFGDSTRVNIVYALRGLWGVILTWLLARWLGGNEAMLGSRVMLIRLGGAILLTAAVLTAMWQ
ncbi:MAG: hypothetical protein KDA85_13280 [Planctomycetaceae bacterium]|nr:hypothetical protein [Planctomycetaceae bacterium]